MIPVARPYIGEEEREAVDRVLRSGMIAMGPEVAAFEEEFAEFTGSAHAVAVNSGTSALHLGLIAAGVQPGDEVIVPSFTFAATGNAVVLAGGTPVYADIDPDTFNLSPEAAEAAITERTVGIMPVHLYGQAANMSAFQDIADRHGLFLAEDAAQAHGATWEGRPVGSMSRMAAFSFYPTKNMTTGEGGMITTDDADVARMARLLRNQGMEQRYANEVVGFNTRLTDIGAAIGRVQLTRVPGWTKQRVANAAVLDDALTAVTVPVVADGATHVYHQYTVRSDDRDALTARLDDAGVGYGVYYPTPVHRLPSFGLDLDLPATEAAARDVLSLPVRPDLTDDEIDAIVSAVNA
ncbi:MAG TPA: DegT/DnrJ/EryC1/StrS family aminotransferase [Nitriliruptoraceae bacterium]|nr:DegT/DnrJ/EryC1/StrS family aminotransferase [Nitriliruptoraceae bacterium]